MKNYFRRMYGTHTTILWVLKMIPWYFFIKFWVHSNNSYSKKYLKRHLFSISLKHAILVKYDFHFYWLIQMLSTFWHEIRHTYGVHKYAKQNLDTYEDPIWTLNSNSDCAKLNLWHSFWIRLYILSHWFNLPSQSLHENLQLDNMKPGLFSHSP